MPRSAVSPHVSSLRKLIAEDECIFLVGDLLAAGSGLPTRAELAEHLREKLGTLPGGSLAQQAQAYKQTFGLEALRVDVKRAYRTRRRVAVPTLYEKLVRIPSTIVAKVTHDDLLDRALRKMPFDVVTPANPSHHRDATSRLVVALLGDLDDTKTLVLTQDDHDELLNLDSLPEFVVAELFQRHPVFLGLNIADPDLRPIIRAIARGRGAGARRAFATSFPGIDVDADYWSDQNLTVLASHAEDLFDGITAPTRRQTAVRVSQPRRRLRRNKPTSPFKFLSWYDEADAASFFGRDEDIEKMSRKLLSTNVVILHSQSGAGKTSLIRAGLVPFLRERGFRCAYSTGWEDPIKQLAEGLDVGSVDFLATLHELNASGAQIILFVDSLEQLLVSTHITRADYKALLDVVVAIARGTLANVRIVLSLREDFLGELHLLQVAGEMSYRNMYRLTNLSRRQAADVVRKSLQTAGLTCSEGLQRLVFDELSTGSGEIYPPQLQIVFDKLALSIEPGQLQLSRRDLTRLGGVQAILTNYVNDVLRALPPADRDVARRVLRALVTSQRTKTKLDLRAVSQRLGASTRETQRLLALLGDNRLVRTDEIGGAFYYELTHEYIIEKINEWLTQEEFAVTRALELVELERYNWQAEKREFMSLARFAQINEEREAVTFDDVQREFLLLTAVALGIEIEYWSRVVPAPSREVIDDLQDMITGSAPAARRNAAVVMAFLAPGDRHVARALEVLGAVGNPHSLTLMKALGVSGRLIGDARRAISSRYAESLVQIPDGAFLMGSTPADLDWVQDHFRVPDGWITVELTQTAIDVSEFYIDRLPVTNEEFAEFDPSYSYPTGRDSHPAGHINWERAGQYARWLGKRLPTEAEWEKAARGTDARRFPWGQEWDARFANCLQSNIGTTTAVGSYPDGASPYGCLDMAGNVWEWMSSLGWPYPYRADDGREDPDAAGVRAMRGAAYSYDYTMLRCALRHNYYGPSHAGASTGFRCAASDGPGKYQVPLP
jgi:formylglycine-generating enzyme required for sulfatase activity